MLYEIHATDLGDLTVRGLDQSAITPGLPRSLLAVEPSLTELTESCILLGMDEALIGQLHRSRAVGLVIRRSTVMTRLAEASYRPGTGDAWFAGIILAITADSLLVICERAGIVSDSLIRGGSVDTTARNSRAPELTLIRVLDLLSVTHRDVVAEYDEVVAELEEFLWGGHHVSGGSTQIWRARRSISEQARLLGAMLPALERMQSLDSTVLSQVPTASWEEVRGTLELAHAQCETLRSMTSEILEAFYAEQGQRLSESSRQLSTALAVIGIPTALASVISLYPATYGVGTFALILCLLVCLAAALWWAFRRRSWL